MNGADCPVGAENRTRIGYLEAGMAEVKAELKAQGTARLDFWSKVWVAIIAAIGAGTVAAFPQLIELWRQTSGH
jgi:hypothetical protein